MMMVINFKCMSHLVDKLNVCSFFIYTNIQLRRRKWETTFISERAHSVQTS